MTPGVWLVIAIVAIILGGICSAIFYALQDLSRPALEAILERKQRHREQRIQRILDDLDGHAASIALPRIALNSLAAVAFTMYIVTLRDATTVNALETTIGVLASTLLTWAFGMVLPHSVARHAGEHTLYSLSFIVRGVYLLTRPFNVIVRFLDEVVRRLAGRTNEDRAEEIKEEVLSVLEEGREDGQVDETEKDMIEAVVSFRDRTVNQIMTPRTEVEAIEVNSDLGKVTAAIRQTGYSRIPVYESTIDRVVGIFYVKDLMRWLAGESSRTGRVFSLRQIVRSALFVPETKTVRELLQELLARRVHIAVVADEYGGMAGIVTIEDIVEEVFGEIQDEYEAPEGEIGEIKVDTTKRSADVDARAYIEDVNEELRPLNVELPESEDYDTVGGFVTVTLGRIPGRGEHLEHENATLTVLDAEPTRVKRVRIVARDTNTASQAQPPAPDVTKASA